MSEEEGFAGAGPVSAWLIAGTLGLKSVAAEASGEEGLGCSDACFPQPLASAIRRTVASQLFRGQGRRSRRGCRLRTG